MLFFLNVMRLHYCEVSTIYIGSEVLFKTCVTMKFVDDDDDLIADVRLLLWQRTHFSCVQSTAHHGPIWWLYSAACVCSSYRMILDLYNTCIL